MKKTLALIALAAASFAASAQVTGFVSYDYDRDLEKNKPWLSQHETIVGAAYGTKLGTFDGGLVVKQVVTGVRDDALGFEVGYTTPRLGLGPVAVAARAALGRVNQIDVGGGGFTSNAGYYSLAAEATMPVVQNVTAFASIRHRNGTTAGAPAAANRLTVGADLAVSPKVAVRVGYAQTWQAGQNLNGVTTAVSYKF